MRQELPAKLAALAERQGGMLTTKQMLDGGLTRQVIRRTARPWVRLMNGLYSTSPPTWMSAVWAGLLAGGKSAAVGGAAALHLEEVLRDPPNLVTAWSTEARANLKLGPYTILLRRGERPSLGTIPRTRVEASLLDLADHASADEVTDAVVRAFTSGKTTAPRLQQALAERGRNAHRLHIHDLCVHAAVGIESVLEWLFKRNVIEAHGLPLPVFQARGAHGRSDGWWPEFKLRLELDGLRDHTDASRDWLRDNDYKIDNDDDTLHYGWNSATVYRCVSATQLTRALTKEGWDDTSKLCGIDCDIRRRLAA